jgi:hypothetical protein
MRAVISRIKAHEVFAGDLRIHKNKTTFGAPYIRKSAVLPMQTIFSIKEKFRFDASTQIAGNIIITRHFLCLPRIEQYDFIAILTAVHFPFSFTK